ncbi:hypothetical protein FI667_g282, partial [Globisporangium splendens]
MVSFKVVSLLAAVIAFAASISNATEVPQVQRSLRGEASTTTSLDTAIESTQSDIPPADLHFLTESKKLLPPDKARGTKIAALELRVNLSQWLRHETELQEEEETLVCKAMLDMAADLEASYEDAGHGARSRGSVQTRPAITFAGMIAFSGSTVLKTPCSTTRTSGADFACRSIYLCELLMRLSLHDGYVKQMSDAAGKLGIHGLVKTTTARLVVRSSIH